MKFCPYCGQQQVDEAVVCTACGNALQSAPAQAPVQPVAPAPVQPQYQAPVQPQYQPPVQPQYQGYAPQGYAQPVQPSGLATAAKVFMILGTIIMGLYLIPLAWCLPMTISYCKKLKTGQPISTGFKVCCLLFVSLLGGIFMLCDKNN